MGNQTFERPFIHVGEGDDGLATFDDVKYAVRYFVGLGARLTELSAERIFPFVMIEDVNKANRLYSSFSLKDRIYFSREIKRLFNQLTIKPSRVFLYHNPELMTNDGIEYSIIFGFNKKPINVIEEINLKIPNPILAPIFINQENVHKPVQGFRLGSLSGPTSLYIDSDYKHSLLIPCLHGRQRPCSCLILKDTSLRSLPNDSIF